MEPVRIFSPFFFFFFYQFLGHVPYLSVLCTANNNSSRYCWPGSRIRRTLPPPSTLLFSLFSSPGFPIYIYIYLYISSFYPSPLSPSPFLSFPRIDKVTGSRSRFLRTRNGTSPIKKARAGIITPLDSLSALSAPSLRGAGTPRPDFCSPRGTETERGRKEGRKEGFQRGGVGG